ncbi:MAG: prolyl oligopeptidase family serine peptidase [Clostridiales bacterium]|nr:MAG: prolyl oligopeptidase family serine peptidase [Clostridiales bacterium]
MFETLERFVQKNFGRKSLPIKRKIYAMGVSMGGYGTWQIAMSLPDTFAAIVPVCGGGLYWNAGRLKNTPVWAFHGGKDNSVKCEESVKMVDAAKNAAVTRAFTIYPENGHDAWSDTYKNYEVFEWLCLTKKRRIRLCRRLFGQQKFG